MGSVLVVDFGSQYTHLIARRIRQLNVFSEVMEASSVSPEDLHFDAIILSGGPSSVYDSGAPTNDQLIKAIIKRNIPTLGICYGMHLLVQSFDGKISRGNKEYGISIMKTMDDPIFKGLYGDQRVWMSHGDSLDEVPKDLEVIAISDRAPAAVRHKSKDIYAFQFHPEVNHTENGLKIIDNFLTIFNIERDWGIDDFIEGSIANIKEQVGEERAIIALSGGVDSSVCAALTAKAIGKNLFAVFVDHGLLRKGEREFVKEKFEKILNLKIIDAKDRFFEKLEGVVDPETKRKIIGNEFIRVFEEEARHIGAKYLVQGTIYPDVIESGSTKNADVIKSHHNVGGLPEDLDFEGLVEPLRDLYKDEVRIMGKRLGMPDEIVFQHPFPGPGLAVRITGPVNDANIDIVREASYILDEELRKADIYKKVWQSFAVLFEDRVVGVVGDQRKYGRFVGLRVVQSIDAMTANFVELPWDLIERISTRITNESEDVVAVSYFVSYKPPQTIEPC
jgi:GMP synthase (glutamine-hydrolysing)